MSNIYSITITFCRHTPKQYNSCGKIIKEKLIVILLENPHLIFPNRNHTITTATD